MGGYWDEISMSTPEHPWPLLFEVGNYPKGTRISIARAKEIAANLRASIAEAEMAELQHAFEREKERSATMAKIHAEAEEEVSRAHQQIATLQRRLKAKQRGKKDSR